MSVAVHASAAETDWPRVGTNSSPLRTYRSTPPSTDWITSTSCSSTTEPESVATPRAAASTNGAPYAGVATTGRPDASAAPGTTSEIVSGSAMS